MLSRVSLLIVFSTIHCLSAWAQTKVSGRVLDQQTKEPLPFVNLVANDDQNGTSTDIDGRFVLENPSAIETISLSYVGYRKTRVEVTNSGNQVIKLKREVYSLRPVEVYPGENPAHRIINKVLENRDKNNPEKNGSFSYKSYNKLVGTIEIDSNRLQKEQDADSADEDFMDMVKLLEKQDLFLMESVTERKFKAPNKTHETILASRVSGLKNPQFGLIATQIQSFTFYEDIFYLGDKEYINPISKNSFKRYLFILEDTILHQNQDSTFIISFRPKTGKRFDGLEGLLYVHTNGYAIEKVLTNPAEYSDGFNISIQQQYEFIEEKKWFPVQTKSQFSFLISDSGTNALVGKIKGYIKDIQLDPELKNREFNHIAVELDPMTSKRAPDFWENERHIPLEPRDSNTYQKLDSLGEKLKFDQKLYVINSLVSGKAPLKFIDIDLPALLKVNGYENVRIGLGMHTNDRFSKHLSIGGYAGYGFGDKAWKYGGDMSFKPYKNKDLQFKVSYINDLIEAGGTEYYNQPPFKLTAASYRALFVNKMDSRERYQGLVSFRMFSYIQPYLFVNSDKRIYNDDYGFIPKDIESGEEPVKEHQLSEMGIGLRYAYNEKYLKLNGKPVSMGTSAPVVLLKYTRGLNGLADGEFEYDRIDSRILKVFNWRSMGKSAAVVTAGYISGTNPRTLLYNAPAAFWKFPLSVDQAFQTMRPNEFFSDKYVNFFFKHSFPRIRFNIKEFQPTPVIYFNSGIGELSAENQQSSPTLSSYELGYSESGIGIDNLLVSSFSGLGIAAIYRIGAYELANPLDNWAFKLTYTFTFNLNKTTAIE